MIIRQKTRTRMLGLLAVPALLLSLAACANTSPTPDSSAESDSGGDAKQWAFDFAECMRSHGIDMEDPNASGGSVALGPQDETPERAAATEACIEELGPSPVSGGGSQNSIGGNEEAHQQLLLLAKCLRDQGFDISDPRPGEGIGMPADLTNEAIEACAEFAPDSVPAQ